MWKVAILTYFCSWLHLLYCGTLLKYTQKEHFGGLYRTALFIVCTWRKNSSDKTRRIQRYVTTAGSWKVTHCAQTVKTNAPDTATRSNYGRICLELHEGTGQVSITWPADTVRTRRSTAFYKFNFISNNDSVSSPYRHSVICLYFVFNAPRSSVSSTSWITSQKIWMWLIHNKVHQLLVFRNVL